MFPVERTHPAHAEIRPNAIDTRSAKAVPGFLWIEEVAPKSRTRCRKGLLTI